MMRILPASNNLHTFRSMQYFEFTVGGGIGPNQVILQLPALVHTYYVRIRGERYDEPIQDPIFFIIRPYEFLTLYKML